MKTVKYVCNWPMVIRDGQNIDFVYEVLFMDMLNWHILVRDCRSFTLYMLT